MPCEDSRSASRLIRKGVEMNRLVPLSVVCLVGSGVWFAIPSVDRAESAQSEQLVTQAARDAEARAQQRTQDRPQRDDDEKPILSKFMRQKLAASNSVLEGLVMDDLKAVTKASDKLLQMSMTEKWRVTNDPTYARFSKDYQRTVERLKAKSKQGTVDGAALAWMDVTLSCIECHEWVRNVVIVELDQGEAPRVRLSADLLDDIQSTNAE